MPAEETNCRAPWYRVDCGGRSGKLEEGPQPKRLKTVVEGPGARMRSEPTTQDILLEQSEMLGEVRDLLAKHLKEAKEIRRGQEDLRRQVAGIGFAIEDIVDMIGGSGEEVEAEIGGIGGETGVGGIGGEAGVRGNGEEAEK